MPYLINAEENELKRLKTTANEGMFGDEEFWTARAPEVPLLDIGDEREWWHSDSIRGFLQL
jgi:hypothetical protein